MTTTTPDAVELLRELRPADPGYDPDGPAAVTALERIVTTPPPREPRRRPVRRVALAGTALAVAGAAAVALVPSGGTTTDVLARAEAALSAPGSILHFRTEIRHRDAPSELRAAGPDDTVDHTMEVWRAPGGRQERVIVDGGSELVEDWDAKTSLAYSPERDEIVRHTNPDLFDPRQRMPQALDTPMPHTGRAVDALEQLLERARRGEGNARVVGETTVRGVAVYELRVDFAVESVLPGGERGTVEASRLVYVDRERFLPVRVVERGPGEIVSTVTDYVEVERLPRTPANERLLTMSAHPGAKRVDASGG